MSWVGDWLGGGGPGHSEDAPPRPPTPLPVPIVHGDAAYVDVSAIGLERLPQQFKDPT